MTNKYAEWTTIISWLLIAVGLVVMIAVQYVPVESDPDLETLGRVSNTLLGGAIMTYGYLIRHASKIDELVGRVEALEEDPKE